MWLNGPRKFAARIAAGFVAVILVLGGVLAIAVVGLAGASDRRTRALQDRAAVIASAHQLRLQAERIVGAGRGELLSGMPELRERRIAAQGRFDAAVAALLDVSSTVRGREQLRAVEQDARAYEDTIGYVTAHREEAADPVRMFEERLWPARQRLETSLGAFVAYENARFDRIVEQAGRAMRRDTFLIICLGLAGILVSAVLAWRFARSLNGMYERERLAVQRAEEAAEARDEILRVLAHDLRSPLNAVLLRATAIKLAPNANEDVMEQARLIERVVGRMDQLIQSLLDAARMEAGRFSLERADGTPSDLVARTVETFDTLASARSLQLRVEPIVTAPLFVDMPRALEVLSYLVDNAIKFTPQGGTVTISTRTTDDSVEFTVSDTGRGIPADQLSHVFDRYWKAGPGGKVGSGLGLYIAKCIVEAHGGRIWVESASGRGSSFTFTLPRAGHSTASTEPVPATG
jgi:signal transduction histidine kinase